MATKRLVDLDGNLSKVTVGSEIVGDGSTAIPTTGYYLVTSVASSGSTLPTGIEVGYLAYLTTSVTPATGDDVKPVTLTNMCYVQNGSIESAKDEIETTTLCDGIKTYRTGRNDLSGSFDGVAEAGNNELMDLINKFFDTVDLSADGSTATINDANNDIFYLQFEVNKATSSANEPVQFYFLPVVISTNSATLSQGSAQTFSANFRVADDGVNSIKPAFYNREVA